MAEETFEIWMEKVNTYLAKANVRSDDIDDWKYYRDYQDAWSPQLAARRALKNAGYPINLITSI